MDRYLEDWEDAIVVRWELEEKVMNDTWFCVKLGGLGSRWRDLSRWVSWEL